MICPTPNKAPGGIGGEPTSIQMASSITTAVGLKLQSFNGGALHLHSAFQVLGLLLPAGRLLLYRLDPRGPASAHAPWQQRFGRSDRDPQEIANTKGCVGFVWLGGA